MNISTDMVLGFGMGVVATMLIIFGIMFAIIVLPYFKQLRGMLKFTKDTPTQKEEIEAIREEVGELNSMRNIDSEALKKNYPKLYEISKEIFKKEEDPK